MLARRLPAALLVALLAFPVAHAQPPQTIGLFQNDPGAFVGYTLFSPMPYTVSYLIDNDGYLVHSWETLYEPRHMAYLLESGNLLRVAEFAYNPAFPGGGAGGFVQELDWDGSVLWEFLYSDSTVRGHHDIEPLPNGNVLMIAWEYKTAAEAIQAGRDFNLLPDGELWVDHVIEIQPSGGTGTIVWEWRAWDHLIQDFDPARDNFGVVEDHPELIDINFVRTPSRDWLHVNSVDYNAEFDQIVISTRLNEFWIIDHSTTTAEAAGHTGGLRGRGGDILYRWGNPQAYRAGTVADQKFYHQHDVQWIEPGLPGEGRILIYNNGLNRPGGGYSTVEEVVTTVDANGDYPLPPPGVPHGPDEQAWIYPEIPDYEFFSGGISGAQRLPNGNTLICEGVDSRFFEIDSLGTKLWEYVSPVDANGPMVQGTYPPGRVFRCLRYAPDYAGLTGKNLNPGGPIESGNVAAGGLDVSSGMWLAQNAPNPFHDRTEFSFLLSRGGPVRLSVYDVRGRLVSRLIDSRLPAGHHLIEWRAEGLASGVYHYVLNAGDRIRARTMVVLR